LQRGQVDTVRSKLVSAPRAGKKPSLIGTALQVDDESTGQLCFREYHFIG
jgi:hypothetical protein